MFYCSRRSFFCSSRSRSSFCRRGIIFVASATECSCLRAVLASEKDTPERVRSK